VGLVALCLATPAHAGAIFASGTLTYMPADYASGAGSIDPNNVLGTGWTLGAGYKGHSYGAVGVGATSVDVVTPSVFAALPGVEVMQFNEGQAQGQALNAIVANFDGTNAITFTPGAGGALYGGNQGRGRRAVDGPNGWADISVNTESNNEVANYTLTSTNSQGVTAIAFMMVAPQDTDYYTRPGSMTVTLSDNTTAVVGFARFGGGVAWAPTVNVGDATGGGGSAFMSYQAPAGLTITNFKMVRNANGSGYGGIDDLAFQVSAAPTPEPATMSMLILGGIGLIGGVIRRRRTA